MSDINSETAKLLEDLRTMIDRGGQFIADQAPPLAREIIAYGRVMNSIRVIGGLIVAITCFCLVRRVYKKCGLWDDDNDHPRPVLFWLIPLTISSIYTVAYSRDFVLAWIAPRLYILEYIANTVSRCNG